jgi:hypothetical protein
MTDLFDLANRCEKATGPDRELDYLILTQALGYRDIQGDRSLFDRGNDGYWSLDGDEKNPPLPSPTTSLDAAMTLVPHDMQRLVRDGVPGGDGTGNDRPFANVANGFMGRGDTLPLALCAAALRARSHKGGVE